MLIVMHKDATKQQIKRVCRVIKESKLSPHPIPGALRVAIGVTGNKEMIDKNRIEGLPGVINVIHVTQPYKLTSREIKPDDTVINLNGERIGGKDIVIIAGPCAVESAQRISPCCRIYHVRG